MNYKWTVLESRVDWITATGKTGTHGTQLIDVGATILTAERERGNNGRPSNFQGYHGTVSQHAFVGYRLDGSCVRLGGKLAGHWWREVANKATNVSRLDVAVTVSCPEYTRDVASDCWLKTSRMERGEGRPLEYTLIQTRGSGNTLYCGRRSSERFGRIYDKHAESKGLYPPGSWRFELEYKGDVARFVADRLGTTTDEPRIIAGLVEQRFQDWGVITPWDSVSCHFNDKAPADPTDNERRMKWLREMVAPCVDKLTVGFTGDELRQALGLSVSTFPQPLRGNEVSAPVDVETRVPHPTLADVYLVSDG